MSMQSPALRADTNRRWWPPFRLSPQFMISSLVLVALLSLWEVAVHWWQVPVYILPPPSQILQALARGLSLDNFWGSERLYYHTAITLSEAAVGFVIGSLAGILIGGLISQLPMLEGIISPYITGFQSLPKVAVAPLFVMWFGFGMMSKVVIIALMVFFPLMINSIAGFKSVERDLAELMRSFSASRLQMFLTVQVPTALPYIFAGLEMGIVYSFLGAVVGEFVGGTAGLGVQVLQMNASMDVSGMFSVLIVLAALGAVSSKVLRFVRRRVLYWAPSETSGKR